jgi:hypothetical protein
MSKISDETHYLAKLAERAGYTTPGHVTAHLAAIIARQQAYLERRQAKRHVTGYDGVVAKDIQVLAAAIVWIESLAEG